MYYYQAESDEGPRLAVETSDGMFDVTSVKPRLHSFSDLCRAADIADETLDTLAHRALNHGPEQVSREEAHLNVPVRAAEVWAAGVTYQISEEAREAESQTPDVYLDVYNADRPEIFFKSTPSRTVGPNDAIGVRGDSDWNVPEPELAVVLYDGSIVGYTIGNDVSSRSIEGENPLYLPQAKVYDRCCSIGPSVVSPSTIEDPHDLTLGMSISRDGETLYDEQTSTSEMVHTCEELVSYYTRHNAVPEMSVLLTGTSLVPEEGFTLRAGDRVDISIEGIGTLSNTVTEV